MSTISDTFAVNWGNSVMKKLITAFLLSASIAFAAPVSDTFTVTTAGGTTDGPATLPTPSSCTTVPAITGNPYTVTSGSLSDLQSKINTARAVGSGNTHVIKVPPATYSIPTTQLNIPVGDPIVIQPTDAAMAALPAVGTRVIPGTHSQYMWKLSGSIVNGTVLDIPLSSNNVTIIGMEATNTQTTSGLIQVGDYSNSNTSLTPNCIGFSRSYIHGGVSGAPGSETRRGLVLQGQNSWVRDSYISNILSSDGDTQAILISNGQGPFLIDNNYLEATGENFMSGGLEFVDILPLDLTFTRNYSYKNPAWSSGFTMKNLFELKYINRVLIEGNVFDGMPCCDQAYGIMVTPASGADSTTTIKNMVFRYNILRNSTGGISLSRKTADAAVTPGERYVLHDNLFYNISQYLDSVQGNMLVLNGVTPYTHIHNNTFAGKNCGAAVWIAFDMEWDVYQTVGAKVPDFRFQDNILTFGAAGIRSGGTNGADTTFPTYFSSITTGGNIFIGSQGGNSTAGTEYANCAAAGLNTTTYVASGAATGKGADFNTLNTKTFGVVAAGFSSMP